MKTKNQPMKTYIKNLFLLPALIAGLNLIPAGRVSAQAFTTLHSFNNSDGANPTAGLILSGNTLYGTAHGGGSSGQGTVFAVNADGTGFTNLHSFTAFSVLSSTNSDGASPYAGLILSGNTLYGTAYQGGSSGNGTVFAVNTNGTGFTNLHSFTALSSVTYGNNSDGANPTAGLILSGNTLYGAAFQGGSSGNGTVFAVNTDGTGFTNLHSFAASDPYPLNSDGANPEAGLILSGNTLYGTALQGGTNGSGTVFAVNTDGTGFTNLHSFTVVSGYLYTNSDGQNPSAGLILSGNTLYGAAFHGGSLGNGTVFAVHTDGTGFTNRHSFTYSDGAAPQAGLILSGNTLYGTARIGGSSGYGTVFAVNTDGTGFTILYSFTATSGTLSTNSDGSQPYAGLILSGNTLYGTATGGGSSSYGTVFSLSFGPDSAPPVITAQPVSQTVNAGQSASFTVTATSTAPLSYQWVKDGVNVIGDTSASLTLSNVQTNQAGNYSVVITNAGGSVTSSVAVLTVNRLAQTINFVGGLPARWGDDAPFGLSATASSGLPVSYSSSDPGVATVSGNTVTITGFGYTIITASQAGNATYLPAASVSQTLHVAMAGTVVAWGDNTYGATTVPAGLSGVTAIAAGGFHTVALKTNGTVVAWGGNGFGQTTVPDGLSGVTAIAAGAYHTVALVRTAPQPQLTIIPSGANVILTWPADAAGFTLQSTTNLVSPAVWITNSPAPVVVNGQNAVTNPVSGTQKFYRLSQ
jgi:uncharacterized repeat protein (TIGR03803 family)